MNRVFYVAFMLVIVPSPIVDGGFVKKFITGIVRGTASNQQAQHNGNPEEDAYRRLNATGTIQGYKNTSAHIVDGDYLTPQINESLQHQQRPTSGYGGGGTYNKKPSSSSPYKNTSAHIVDEDYLTPNPNELIQQRPTSGYGGGGTYDKKPSSSSPYKNTTGHIVDGDYLTPNGNESLQHQQRPTSGYGGGGTYDKKPTQHHDNRYDENGYGQIPRGGTLVTNSNQSSGGALRHGLNTQTNEEEDGGDGDCITLTSDDVTCVYSNIKDEKIENRKMICNNTECSLENNSKKSSLWICDKIKCTVANIDFGEDVQGKKLLECTMDVRSIITGQEKPVRCGPDEKEHNGRCRKVFGA